MCMQARDLGSAPHCEANLGTLSILRRSRQVVAPHGAGLANLIFAPAVRLSQIKTATNPNPDQTHAQTYTQPKPATDRTQPEP